MTDHGEKRLVEPASRSEWRAWLGAHAEDHEGVWLVLHKGRGVPLTYTEAVEEALAAGWIDSRANKLDAERYKLWVAPRKRGSVWAPSNKDRVARLTQRGLMTPRGLGIVDAAKLDGSWTSLDEVMALRVPADLQEAFEGNPEAAENFDRFPASSKRMILDWIRQAKRPETRRRRVEEAVGSAAENIRAHHWRRAKGDAAR